MSAAKVELGRHLFFDSRLSGNASQSCASCHDPQKAFTDGKSVSIGSTGQPHPRNAMSLTNVAYSGTLMWAHPNLRRLEEQALVPMFAEDPVELGLAGKRQVLIDRLESTPLYRNMFASAYPKSDMPITLETITKALAAFQRTLISANSPYDQWLAGDANAISAAAKRGHDLFFSERFECFHCHGGFNFSGSIDHQSNRFEQIAFHNNGLYNIDGEGGYPANNTGVYAVSGEPEDMGHFKAPTLRNVAVTAPYMHDGSMATLGEVIEHYARGGRHIDSGPHAGDGAENPLKSRFVRGFSLTAREKADLISFLEALTDTTFLNNPAHANPFAD